MSTDKISYHKAAEQFLRSYYETGAGTNSYFRYRFINRLVAEAKRLSKDSLLKEMNHQDAVTATWFCYAGLTAIPTVLVEEPMKLLNEYFNIINYPEEHRSVVEIVIRYTLENKKAESDIQKVVSDAVFSQFSQPDFLEDMILLKDEANKVTAANLTELFHLKYYEQLFIQTRYYTPYGIEHYTAMKEKNFKFLEKRIRKLEDVQSLAERDAVKMNGTLSLTNKETEDIFKIAFRNYNQLISVADSKASLLINVNSIIVSVMLAFVLSKVERNLVLLWPTTLLLTVCMTTIFFSILASRPQKNIFSKSKKSHSYQRFFFGSFDLIDPSFRHAGWEDYFNQLNDLFTSSREMVYMEVYKETFNVRKVLSKKFNYLSMAYWVFIIGLLISITAFIVAIQSHKIV